jgi:uncharacterized protein YbjT (DUF2867 family)
MFVITGATGHTGSVVAKTLLAQKKPVRALVHTEAKAAALRDAGAEVVAAELDDAGALERALAGATGAYFLLPTRPTSNQVLADQSRVIAAFAGAVEQNRVPHVVLLSSIGGHLAEGNGPIRSLHEGEQRLKKTGAAVTAIRAAYFMENWFMSFGALGAGVLPTFLREGLAIPMIASRDIGLLAARALAEGGRGFQAIELAGPRDYTAADVAKAVGAILGKTITPQYAPESAVVPTFTAAGMSADLAGLYLEMIHGFNSGKIGYEGGAARSARGTIPIEDVLRPALAGKA